VNTSKFYLSKGVEGPRERREEPGRRGKADQPVVTVEVSRRVKENQPGNEPGRSGSHPKGQARAKGLGEEGHVPAGPRPVLKEGFESIKRRGVKKGDRPTIDTATRLLLARTTQPSSSQLRKERSGRE
jgi:hypothetical protein